MNDLVTKVVYCLRDDKVIGGPYRVSYARTFGSTSPPLSETAYRRGQGEIFRAKVCIAAVRGNHI